MIAHVKGATSDLWAQLRNGAAGFDFRTSAPLVNLGTGGSALDLTANGSPTHAVGSGYTLNGTSQWLSDADNDLWDMGAAEPMTVFYAGTATGAGFMLFAAKRNTVSATAGTAAGWSLGCTSRRVDVRYSDGATVANSVVSLANVFTDGVRFVAAARFGATGVRAFFNGSTAGSSNATRPTGSAANAEEFRVGRLSGAGTSYLTGSPSQILAVRAELSDADIATISALLANP